MAKPNVAHDMVACERDSRFGPPELVKIDAEDAGNAIAVIDDAIRATMRAKLEAVDAYDSALRMMANAKRYLAQSIAKHERRNQKAIA